MFAQIDGIKVNYIDNGVSEKENPVVLLLHGWGCNGETYRKITEHLSPRFRVIIPDLPGFGKSPEPPELPKIWGIGEYADLIRKFCEKLELNNIIFLGHSLGCRIIIKLLAEGFPLTATKAIMTGAAGIKPRKSLAGKIKTAVFKAGKAVLKPFPRLLTKLQNRSGSADYRAASPVMRKCLVKIVNEDLTPLLHKVKPSILLIWGENDNSTPLSDARIMERLMPDAGVAVIRGAGHYAFLDQTELFLRILDSYLGGNNE